MFNILLIITFPEHIDEIIHDYKPFADIVIMKMNIILQRSVMNEVMFYRDAMKRHLIAICHSYIGIGDVGNICLTHIVGGHVTQNDITHVCWLSEVWRELRQQISKQFENCWHLRGDGSDGTTPNSKSSITQVN